MKLVKRFWQHSAMIGATLATLILFAIAGILAGFELLHVGTPDKVVRVVSFPDEPGFWETYQTLMSGIFTFLGGALAFAGTVFATYTLYKGEKQKQENEHRRADAVHERDLRIKAIHSLDVVIGYCTYLEEVCSDNSNAERIYIDAIEKKLEVELYSTWLHDTCRGILLIEETPFFNREQSFLFSSHIKSLYTVSGQINAVRQRINRNLEMIRKMSTGDTIGFNDHFARAYFARAIQDVETIGKCAAELKVQIANDMKSALEAP